jgi:hypothetical protein
MVSYSGMFPNICYFKKGGKTMLNYIIRNGEKITKEQLLTNTIEEDIKLLMEGENYDYFTLIKCKSGLFQLCFCGRSLWLGTLDEINAIIKSLNELKAKNRLIFASTLEGYKTLISDGRI